MRNRRVKRTPSQNEPYEPTETPVVAEPTEEPAAPEAPSVEASEAESDEPWVNPLILAARRGEQVEFGGEITPVEGNPATADPEE